MLAPAELRQKKERIAALLYEKRKREERELQADLGERGSNGQPPRPGGLMHFIRYFWHILEPTTPLIEGWVMQAIALHLEAITRGEIKRCVINVPPGFCKSLMVNVFWPAWEWSAAGLTSTRYVTFSYGAHLTLRDNAKFRDLVQNYQFQEIWGDVVKLKKAGEVKPENDATGWKFASSVGGIGTGERGGRVLCLPGDQRILTSWGWMDIGTVVDNKLPVKVAGLDHRTDTIVWQNVEAYERNPAAALVEILCGDARLKCTPDHPVFVQGKSYVRADQISVGDKLVCTEVALENVQTRVVTSVEAAGQEDVVYNVRVAPCHNYFAEGFLVHNCDDLHSVRYAESEQVRGETVRWVREGMSNRLNSMLNDVILGIGQRVHEDDASAAMLEDPDYVHLMIPMEYDAGRHCATKIGWEDPRTEDGELAWPERFPREVVEKLKKTLGPYAYSAQYQQAPTPRGGAILKREWWQLWTEDEYPPCYFKWASADTAYTEKEENDPTGFTVWGMFDIGGQPNIILMDAWRKRLELHIAKNWYEENTTREARHSKVLTWQRAAMAEYKAYQKANMSVKVPSIHPDLEPWHTYISTGLNTSDRWPDETYEMWRLRTQEKWGLCEWLIHSCRRFKVNELLIEGKASGLSVAQELRRLAGNEGWGVQTPTPEGDKTARAFAIQSILSAGLVWAPEREWSDMAISEANGFPKGRYKDVTDSMTQALKYVRDIGLLIRPEERELANTLAAQYRPQTKPLYPV